MTGNRLSFGKSRCTPKQKLRYAGTLPATGDAGDCGEIPNFEYKLRVRGTEKSRKQRLANGRCGGGGQRLRHMTAAGAGKISLASFICG